MLKNQFTSWSNNQKFRKLSKLVKYGNRVSKPGSVTEAGSKEKHDISCMGPYAGADYTSPSLCGLRVESRLQHAITTGNPMPKLTFSVRDVGFGLRAAYGNRVSHKNMNPSLTCPFSLFICVAITNLFRDHTPAVLLPRKRTVKQGCQQKHLGHTAWEKKPYSVIEIKFS
jgi:hypothetical protein